MAKISKRKKEWKEKVDPLQRYELKDAIQLVKDLSKAKFGESVDISVRLGIDSKKTEQAVRGGCSLPHGTGKEVRVLVFAKGDKVEEAQKAGADFVGGEDLVAKIQGGWLEFDRVVATPDMMAHVGKIGRLLGPRGLMPNPKVGTVTFDVGAIVGQIKKGQVQFKVDKGSNIHVPVGKSTFEVEKLAENIQALVETLIKLKPAAAKGIYLKNIAISSTMGPGVSVNTAMFR
ncbi:MAG: large subunit ribosomal protein L1 [bacterium]|jgi:large subunit ribosomal protein L1